MGNIIMLLVLIVIIAGGWFLYRYLKRPKPLDKKYYRDKWKDLQRLCSDKKSWPQALIMADGLLDDALKKRKLGGKNYGERLVKAQKEFSDNDAVWFAHKLRNKIESEPNLKLKESKVKEALIGFRQALKDLGALPNDQPRKS